MKNNKIEHVSNIVKNVADASAGSAVVYSWIASLTPFLNFVVLVLAITWGIYRIHDMRLSVKIKEKQLNGGSDENN